MVDRTVNQSYDWNTLVEYVEYIMQTVRSLSLGLVVGAMGLVPASAAVITLDFEGIGDQEAIGDFYNGGGGEDFGVTFSDNALGVIDADAGGNGNFGNEPTPDTIMFFLTGDAATLNFTEGFETGFSFFYTAINDPGNIDVYDGVGATGSILASLDLPTTPSETGDPTGDFNVFEPIGVEFSGVAKSIDFGGTIDQIGFDNITFGSGTPGDQGGSQPESGDSGSGPNVVPLPASLPLLVAGFGVLGALRARRKKA